MSTATDVREQVVELAREFAREKIEPFAAEWDRTSHFPRDVVDELGALGFWGCARRKSMTAWASIPSRI